MKLPLIISLVSIFLFSCSSPNKIASSGESLTSEITSSYPGYKIDEETYNTLINKDNILFRSNFTFSLYNDSGLYMETELDYGKVHNYMINSDYHGYFLVEEKDGKFYITRKTTMYSFSQEVTRERLYSYFFYDFLWLFEIPYSTWNFDETSLTYKCSNISIEGNKILNGEILVENNLPSEISFNLQNEGYMRMTFTKYNETSVTLPETSYITNSQNN